jgi:hypothetical protein
LLTDFYVAFSTVCFTLLGLWLVVVQTRHAEWRDSAWHRRRAFVVMLHFALPGTMTLISLVDPRSVALWRTAFAVTAAGGVISLVALLGRTPTGAALVGYAVAVLLYAVVCLIAVVPGVVTYDGGPAAVRIESVLLVLVVFLGVNVAWLLLFEPAPDQRVGAGPARPGTAE